MQGEALFEHDGVHPTFAYEAAVGILLHEILFSVQTVDPMTMG